MKVMTANFSLFFAFYVLTPLLPLYLSEQFHATKDVIGLVLSGYTITALIVRPFSGYVVDTFDRKRVLMVCYAAFFIFFAGYLAASTLLLFCIVRTLHGAPFGALTVANSTMAIDVLPSSRRNEGIGYYGLSNNLAMAIAPTVGLFVYRYTHSFDLLFWIALLVAGFGMTVDGTVKRNEELKIKNEEFATALDAMSSLPTSAAANSSFFTLHSSLSLDRFFLLRGWLLGVNMVFFGFCFGVLSNYLAIYGKEVMGIEGGTGPRFMISSLCLILSRLQGGKALREGRLTHNASEGMVISLIGYVLFIALPTLSTLLSSFSTLPSSLSTLHLQPSTFKLSLLPLIGYYASALLIGLGNGHMWPAFQNMMISVARHDQRGTANSTILVSWDIGMGLGILLGGIMAEHFGYAAAFWFVALMNLTGVVLYFAATRQFFIKRRL